MMCILINKLVKNLLETKKYGKLLELLSEPKIIFKSMIKHMTYQEKTNL